MIYILKKGSDILAACKNKNKLQRLIKKYPGTKIEKR